MGTCFRVILAVVGLAIGCYEDSSCVRTVGIYDILTEQLLLGCRAIVMMYERLLYNSREILYIIRG